MDVPFKPSKWKLEQFGRRETSAVEESRMNEESRAVEQSLREQCPEPNHDHSERERQPAEGRMFRTSR